MFQEEYNVDISLLDKINGERQGYYDLIEGSLPYLQELRRQEGFISYGQIHMPSGYNFTPSSPVLQPRYPPPQESPPFNLQSVSWRALPNSRSAHQDWTETTSQRSPMTSQQSIQSTQETKPRKRWASVVASGTRERRSTNDDQTADSSDRKSKEPSVKSPVFEHCENAVVDIAENSKRRGKQYVNPFAVHISGRCA